MVQFNFELLIKALERGNEDEAISMIKGATTLDSIGIKAALSDAACYGCPRVVEHMLTMGADVDHSQCQPIRMAVMYGHLAIAERLLSLSKIESINVINDIFAWTAFNGCLAGLAWLVSKGYELTDSNQEAALYFAIKQKHVDVLRFLVYELGCKLELIKVDKLVPKLEEMGAMDLVQSAVAAHVATELNDKRNGDEP